MQAQILSLQCSSPLTRPTLSQIFQHFSPVRVGLKELACYVQINDQAQSAEFVRMVKNGAYPELKPEIYEILANANSESDCFKNCAAVLCNLEQVAQYFLKQDTERMIQTEPKYDFLPPESEKRMEKEEEVELDPLDMARYEQQQDDTTILFQPIYEPSSKFEVEFEDDSPLAKERESKEEPKNQIEQDQASNPTTHFEVLQVKKEPENDLPVPPTTEIPLQTPRSTAQKSAIPSSYYLAVLLIWVIWMII